MQLTNGHEPGAGPIDWHEAKAQILARLDVVAEYAALGVEFTRSTATTKGWRPCRAFGRPPDNPDDSPSAAVNIISGVYHDKGDGGSTISFFDFALRHGAFGQWMDVIRHYATKADVTLGKVERSSHGKILEAVYEYRDGADNLIYGVHRYRMPNGKKDFRQYAWKDGGWVKESGCMDGIEPLPYRLPTLLKSDPSEPVWILEGERDVDRAVGLGLVATTNHQGCSSTDRTWPRFVERGYFSGRTCYVVPDNDPGGQKHARKVADLLIPSVALVKLVALPGLGPRGDLSDWLDSGHDVDELLDLARDSPPWTGQADAPEADETPDDGLGPEDVVTVCLSDVVSVPVEWLWPDRIPLGKITLLAGDPKLGKSFLTMDLAARVSGGKDVPSGAGECFSAGSVVLLSAEDDLDDTIKPRLESAGADTDKIHALTTIRLPGGGFGPFNLSYIPHLERAIVRFPDTLLVIIDPVTHYIGAGIDDHKNAALRAVLGPLKDLAYRRKVAILIVTHLNKGSGTKALNRVTGSLAYTAVARASWLVVKDPEDPKRRLMLSIGNNLVEDPAGLAYRIVDGRVEWEPEPVLMSANDALQKEQEERRPDRAAPAHTKMADAVLWLGELLATGDIPSEQVFDLGNAKGFRKRMLYDAKEKLGIVARRDGFGAKGQWLWSLPKDAGNPQGPGQGEAKDDDPPY